jgi:hypothetical protein
LASIRRLAEQQLNQTTVPLAGLPHADFTQLNSKTNGKIDKSMTKS